jgi:Protein of unknown function (DUF2827)
MNYLPGNTEFLSEELESSTVYPLISSSKQSSIILASNEVTDSSLFINGLTQNILVLYELFESLGYECYLLQHSKSDSEKKEFIFSYRTIYIQDIIKMTIPITAFIEIGMSIDNTTRNYLRSIGTKLIKLYLGNILNIDIETIQYYPSMFFNHHLVGEIDEIWTSPHYYQHLEYAAILNQTEIENSKVVPYVWDSCFITQYGTKEHFEWIPCSDWKSQDIIIMDPSISFQKCTFYSLLLIEAFSKKYPEWKGNVHIINGDRLKMCLNSYHYVLPSLSLYTSNRIHIYGRKKIHEILKDHRSACFITHQWNNDYNYLTLELFYCNYPIVHNSEGWSNYGYYYSINEWDTAIDTVYHSLKNHKKNLNIYKSHAANLIWKHSPYNPSIQQRWKKILEFK